MVGYLGLGSNMGDRQAHLRAGVAGLCDAGVEVLDLSSVWESEPVDSPDPGWFLNMAAKVESSLAPMELLDRLLAIERRQGRVRRLPNGARTLDMDILMLGGLRLADERLEVPHPRMWERKFVLEPLAEIAPDLVNPDSGLTVDLERLRSRDRSRVVRVGLLASGSGLTVESRFPRKAAPGMRLPQEHPRS